MPGEVIGRTDEKRFLDKLVGSAKAEFLVVYGRRRVGKTYLVYEYLKPQLVFAFSGAYGVPVRKQIGNFFTEYLRFTHAQLHTEQPAHWQAAFTYLAEYLRSLNPPPGQKAIAFLDELPWLDTPKSGFAAALEYFWNQHVSKMDHVLLIACGSVASWMEKKLLKAKGGLYNRVTATLYLQPFTLAETATYCQHRQIKLSHYQITQLYMAMGGIPFYLNSLSPGKSVVQLIDEVCFSPTGLLAREYEHMYHSLFKRAESHMAIVEQLAAHPYGMVRNALLKNTGLPTGTFARSLADLVESGFVIKLLPFQKKGKGSVYRLMDMYSLFYLRFIKGNTGQPGISWKLLATDNSYAVWCGYAYENICLLHLQKVLHKLGISGILSRTSSWYFKGNEELPGAQIDLLIDRKDGMINLCEVKFTNKEFIITKEYAAALRQKIAVFEAASGTRKTVLPTLITTYPAVVNTHYQELVSAEITMDDLF